MFCGVIEAMVLGLRWAPIISTFTHLHFYAVFAAVCVTDTADGVSWLVCVCVCVCVFRCGGGGQ